MPKVGHRLRCSACGQRQRFGSSGSAAATRARREIAGITRFSDRRAPAAKRALNSFDDPISDLFKVG
jgi:hypothetical protein